MDIFETYKKLKEDLHMSASPNRVDWCLKQGGVRFSKTKRLFKELKEFEKNHPELLI